MPRHTTGTRCATLHSTLFALPHRDLETLTLDERLIFLEGTHVRLKVPTREDALSSDWAGWFNNAEVSRYNLHHFYPVTIEEQLAFVDSCNTDSRIQLAVVDRSEETSICGMVSLASINLIHRNAELAVIMDNRRTAKKPKIVLEAWSLMLQHGFQQFGLEKIYGGTFHPQIADVLVKTFGFEIEGIRRRQVFKDGTFHDVTTFGVFRDTVTYPTL